MRPLILVAGTALTLAACGNNDQRDNTTNVDENLTAENIVSNDVTAIDAVTGDASNMAADVNYMNEDNSVAPLASNGAAPKQTAKPKPKAAEPATTPPSGNTLENTTG